MMEALNESSIRIKQVNNITDVVNGEALLVNSKKRALSEPDCAATDVAPVVNETEPALNSPQETDEQKLASIKQTSEFLLSRTKHRPQVAIICGTGLGGLADLLQDVSVFEYKDIPKFVTSGVQGHAGKLIFGMLSGKCIVCMQGRNHVYEGHSMWQVTFPVRVFACIGVSVLIVTNASGALNDNYSVADVMIIKDHINLPGICGLNPLIGLNDPRYGTRFQDLVGAYDVKLQQLIHKCAHKLDIKYIREGVYVYQTGPCFETIAEVNMMRLLGADVAGMSTVPEVIVARQCGLRCAGLSLITNHCIMDYDTVDTTNHEAVLLTASTRASDLNRLFTLIIRDLTLQ